MSENKFVVITGCSSGIGYCAAKALHQRGYSVIATVRKPSDEPLLHDLGIEHVVLLDLADSDSVQRATSKILMIAQHRVFALFNNAAYGQPGAVEDLSRAALRHQLECNLLGTHELTIGLLPSMLSMSDARIVQNSSVLGFVAMPMRGAYNASKFALEGLSDTLRQELIGTPIKLSIIQPGPIISRFRENALQALKREVDFSRSRHAALYQKAVERLSKPGPAAPFTLPPEAVVKALIHALEAKRPRYRYRVTTATKLMALLKYVLPTAWLDHIAARNGG